MNKETKIKGTKSGNTEAIGGVAIKKIVTVGADTAINGEVIQALRECGMNVYGMKSPEEAAVFIRQNKEISGVLMMLPPESFAVPENAKKMPQENTKIEEIKEEVGDAPVGTGQAPKIEGEELSDNLETNDEIQSNLGDTGLNQGTGDSVQ